MHFCFASHKPSSRMSGFTLIELMISVVIVAVLAAVAVPSYTAYIARARRAEARTHLVEAAQFMQRFYTANDSFVKDRKGNDVFKQMPPTLQQSPAQGTQLYTLVIPTATLTVVDFEIRMEPVAGGAMGNDACGTFTLTSTGLRGVLVNGVPDTGTLRDTCWK